MVALASAQQGLSWPHAFAHGSILLTTGLMMVAEAHTAERSPRAAIGLRDGSGGTRTHHPLTWKTLGADTRQASAEERVAPKIPAVMRGPNPDTMLMLCPTHRCSGTCHPQCIDLCPQHQGSPAPGSPSGLFHRCDAGSEVQLHPKPPGRIAPQCIPLPSQLHPHSLPVPSPSPLTAQAPPGMLGGRLGSPLSCSPAAHGRAAEGGRAPPSGTW